MIRKHTVFLDKSIETVNLQVFTKANETGLHLARLSMRLSMQPEISTLSVNSQLREVYRTLPEDYANWFYRASKVAHRTEAVLKRVRDSESHTTGVASLLFKFYTKRERKEYAWIMCYFGELGQVIEHLHGDYMIPSS